jgi:ATP-dependent DNA helicase RecQ
MAKSKEEEIKIANRNPDVPPEAFEAFLNGQKKMPMALAALGYTALRPGQDRAVRSIMMGVDSVVILPTGMGKSACFVVPTLCMGWKTIVIYPLISLMRDQAQAMQRNGLKAATISSDETDAHNASVLREWAAGDLQMMLVSPERFSNKEWASVVSQYPPDFVAMDEGHTFSNWADTFRPGYKFAGAFIQKVSPKVVAVFSATLTEDAEKEVREGLGIPEAKLIYHVPRRTNLHLATMGVDTIADAYPWLVQDCKGPTIVYCSTRKRVEMCQEMMARYTRRPVFMYHGGMKPATAKKLLSR